MNVSLATDNEPGTLGYTFMIDASVRPVEAYLEAWVCMCEPCEPNETPVVRRWVRVDSLSHDLARDPGQTCRAMRANGLAYLDPAEAQAAGRDAALVLLGELTAIAEAFAAAEPEPEPGDWRVISIDNFDREIIGTSDDRVEVAEISEAAARALAGNRNAEAAEVAGDDADRYYKAVPPDYALRIYRP